MGYITKIIWAVIILFLVAVIFKRPNIDHFAAKVLCDKKIPPESERKLVETTLEYQPVQAPFIFQKIPRIIIQTNEKDMVPEDMAKASQTIIDANPEYEYIYFDDQRALEYISENFPENIINAYEKVKPGAYKADLFRYCFLYKNGGVYIDTGMKEIMPLKDLIKPEDNFISPEDNNTRGLYNAFICCAPSHPIIKAALDESVYNIENDKYGEQPLDVTGPTVFGRAFERVTGDPVVPNTRYAQNVRVIKYIRTGFCNTSGEIWDGASMFFITRYPTYHIDASWYNTNQHYSDMWKQKAVFNQNSDISLRKHQRSLMSLFKIFIGFAEKHNLVYWASSGTLLGAIREKKMIPWDDDVDVDVPRDTVKALLSLQPELNELGLKLEFDDYIWRIRYLHEDKAYIDLFEYTKVDETWKYFEEYNTQRWPNSYYKDNEIFPLKDYKFGNLTIKGPNNPVPYLEHQYGKWQTPVQEKGHHTF